MVSIAASCTTARAIQRRRPWDTFGIENMKNAMPSIDSSIRWRLIANDGSRCSLVLAVPVDEAVVPVSFFGLHLFVDELREAETSEGLGVTLSASSDGT